MGVSIDMHVYDYFELVKSIREKIEEEPDRVPEGRTLNEFVEKILPEFGIRAGDKFITLWNEYYDDYNAASQMFQAIELYFGVEDGWIDNYSTANSGANAYEVLTDKIGDDFDE